MRPSLTPEELPGEEPAEETPPSLSGKHSKFSFARSQSHFSGGCSSRYLQTFTQPVGKENSVSSGHGAGVLEAGTEKALLGPDPALPREAGRAPHSLRFAITFSL